MVGEFFGDLFRGHKDKSASKDNIEQLRTSGVYQRLKDKFTEGKLDVRGGFQEGDLTVGDLVDVLHLYLVATESSTRGIFQPIAEMARLSLGDDVQKTATEELKRLSRMDVNPESFDRENALYSLPVNIQQAIDEGKDELTHYPGG